MNIRYNLTHPDEKQSGIRIIVTHKGKVYRKAVPDITIPSKDWSIKKQRSGHPKIDARLKAIRLEIEAKVDSLSSDTEVQRALTRAFVLFGGEEVRQRTHSLMWEQYDKYASVTNRFRRLAYERVKDIMGDSDDYEDIDKVWQNRLKARLEERDYSLNYISSIIGRFKTFLKYAYDQGWTDVQAYVGFKTKWQTADTTYLTKEEVDRLWNAELKGRDAMARDLFIIGIYTAARFQNYSKFTMDNINNRMLEFVQGKTCGRVIMPASSKVIEVLQRNGGKAPKMSQQELNRRIKDICKGLGMDETVEVVIERGGKKTIEKRQRDRMISSHTARRTGATLLYLSGVPMRQCMMITGHTTEVNFMKYIKVTKEQNAWLLADNPFFK